MRCALSDLLVHIKSRMTGNGLTRRYREKSKEQHPREGTAPQHVPHAEKLHLFTAGLELSRVAQSKKISRTSQA